MYPHHELTRLGDYKAALQQRIVLRRVQCVDAAAHIAQPLELLDRILGLWRKFSPLALFAAVPIGFIAKRVASPRLKILGTLIRWSPLVFAAMRGIRSVVTDRFETDGSSNNPR